MICTPEVPKAVVATVVTSEGRAWHSWIEMSSSFACLTLTHTETNAFCLPDILFQPSVCCRTYLSRV
jgi:hypothetical protein